MKTLLTDQFQPSRTKPLRAQIAEHLRELIAQGKLAPGTKLPTTQALAKTWQTKPETVHAAMRVLVKEGIIERSMRLGTFVAQRPREAITIGLCLVHDIWHDPVAAFRRTLVSQLGSQLRSQGIMLDVWVDPRPVEEHVTPWQEFITAVEQRRMQGLLLPNSWRVECPWVGRLPIATVELATPPGRGAVAVDISGSARLAAEELSRMGCRSVGMISAVNRPNSEASGDPYTSQVALFRQQAQKSGMASCDEWFPPAMVLEGEAEHFGYEAMKRLLALPQRPEGVYVYHDLVARGALTAVLENGISVPEDLKLVFYRNKEISWLCPVPVAFVELSVAEVAAKMIEALMAQLRGEDSNGRIVKPRMVSAAQRRAPEGVAAM